MTDNKKAPDQKNDESVKVAEPDLQVTDSNIDDIVNDVDKLLAESDPQFLENMKTVQDQKIALSEGMNLGFTPDADLRVIPKKSLKEAFLETIDFKGNRKKVIFFWSSVLFIVLIAFSTTYLVGHQKRKSLFLTSYAEWNLSVESYNPITDTQPFYENPHLSKNIMTLKKMTANIKNSSQSGPNPMLAFEIAIEGLSKDVIIEVKDRESEFMDIILRTVEDYSYDELEETLGKQKMADKIIEVVNLNLSKGQIRKVLYSSFILKP